jgi:hypothetical protein
MLLATPDSLYSVRVNVLDTEPAVTTTLKLFPSVPAFLDVTVAMFAEPLIKFLVAASASSARRR